MFIKQDVDEKLVAIAKVRDTVPPSGWAEITEAEYNRLLKEIRDKAAYVDAVATDPAAIETVPEEWREEIQRRADEEIQRRKEAEEAAKQLSDEELADMIEGVM